MRYALLLPLVACGPIYGPSTPVPPPPPPPPVLYAPPPTTYIQNAYIYNNVTAPVPSVESSEPEPEPEIAAPVRAPDPPPVAPRAPQSPRTPPPYCVCMASAVLPAERQHLASTTIASCDEYLELAELGVYCATSQPGPTQRVQASLDLSRRSWRASAATDVGHASLVDSCAVALSGMKSANADACR